jgi:hypothetical protein
MGSRRPPRLAMGNDIAALREVAGYPSGGLGCVLSGANLEVSQSFEPRRKPRWSGAVAGGLFRRCDLFDRRLFGFGLFAMFIGGVQEPIDQPGAALMHDPRVLGLLLVVEDFVIFCVAHGILHLRSALTVKQLRNTVYSPG